MNKKTSRFLINQINFMSTRVSLDEVSTKKFNIEN